MTDIVNGYPIVAMFPTPETPMTLAGRFILVDRGTSPVGRWVVAWQGEGDDCWHHGHYIDDGFEARTFFLEKCAEEIGREIAPPSDPVLSD